MQCMVCGSTSAGAQCSFHPGNLAYIQTSDARTDYRDVYRWSCCAKHSLSDAQSDADVVPIHAPGCTVAPAHINSASLLLWHSKSRIDFAEKCETLLREMGYDVDVLPLGVESIRPTHHYFCIAVLPDEADATTAIDLAESQQALASPPWVIVFSALHAAQARTQTSAASLAEETCHAIVRGVRMRHGGINNSPFNVFLSYRRTDLPVAKTLNKRLASWWDKHVLTPGVDWASEIEVGVRSCSLFVLLLRGDIPPESYVWRELSLAQKHRRPVAILAFEDEGEAALLKYGLSVDMLEWCELLTPATSSHHPPIIVGRYLSVEYSVLYFRRLTAQLNWPSRSEDADAYDTDPTISLLNMLRDFPQYRFYSTDPWRPLWELMKPVERASK